MLQFWNFFVFFFWIRKLSQTHNHNTSDLRKLSLFYRQLQILSVHYRLSFSQFQLGFAIPSFIAFQTACLYNTIVLISGKDTGGPIWFNLMYACEEVDVIFLVNFVFGILADVYNFSNGIQKQLNERYDLKRTKWFKRWIKSCPVLKIYFGGSNYVDRLTPLNIQDFTINQTVSLMLLHN